MSHASTSVPTVDKISSAPVRPRRKSGKTGKSSQPVVRPLDPPPAPPINHNTHPLSSSAFSANSSSTSDKSESVNKSEIVKSDLDNVDNLKNEEPYTSTLFLTEPLYQLLVCDNKPGCDSDLSESSNKQDIREKHIATMLQKTSRSSVQELLVSNTGQRSLWSDLPEVIESGILEKISNSERKLQEAIFEIISSEASYLKSLNVLINHFANSPKFVGDYAVLCPKDRVILFNDVYEVNQ